MKAQFQEGNKTMINKKRFILKIKETKKVNSKVDFKVHTTINHQWKIKTASNTMRYK